MVVSHLSMKRIMARPAAVVRGGSVALELSDAASAAPGEHYLLRYRGRSRIAPPGTRCVRDPRYKGRSRCKSRGRLYFSKPNLRDGTFACDGASLPIVCFPAGGIEPAGNPQILISRCLAMSVGLELRLGPADQTLFSPFLERVSNCIDTSGVIAGSNAPPL
jgi:hypothetical protein